MSDRGNSEERRRVNPDTELLKVIDYKINSFLEIFRDHVKENKDDFEDHEDRIRVIEKKQDNWEGRFLTAYAGMGVLFTALNLLLHFYLK